MPHESRSFSVESWEALESRLVQMQLGGTTEAEIDWRVNVHSDRALRSMASVLLARGKNPAELSIQRVTDPGLYVERPDFGRLKILRDTHTLDKNDRSLCLAINTSENTKILNYISERAHAMLQSKAYLHHYEKYGLGGQEIIEYLTIFENILNDYKKI